MLIAVDVFISPCESHTWESEEPLNGNAFSPDLVRFAS